MNNTEITKELNQAKTVAEALAKRASGLDLYAAETIELLMNRINRQEKWIRRYEDGEPSPVIREHIESLQRTIAAQSERIDALRGTIERLTRETPEQRMKEQICFRSVSGEQPEGRI